ncbi:MAG: zinc-binding dehydrogenase [Bdellovibrionales bacterium]|nr:zinc-binding dehydrogenase [Bdellovibrionales bacterium]
MPERILRKFPLGALVTAEEMQWCGRCDQCRFGQPNHCEALEEIGFTRDGSHAELIAVDARYLWPLAPLESRFGADAALRMGAMVEPYAVSYRALFQGAPGNRWAPGSRVVILGAGPIGLAALDLARAAGAASIAVVEPREDRRHLAMRFGAGAAREKPDDLPTSLEFDWVIDAAGAGHAAMEIAARHLSVGGSVCFLARTDAPAAVWPEMLITKNARVFGSQGHSGEGAFRRVIDMMAEGLLHPLEMLEGVCSLPEAGGRLSRQHRGAGKILVRPLSTDR